MNQCWLLFGNPYKQSRHFLSLFVTMLYGGMPFHLLSISKQHNYKEMEGGLLIVLYWSGPIATFRTTWFPFSVIRIQWGPGATDDQGLEAIDNNITSNELVTWVHSSGYSWLLCSSPFFYGSFLFSSSLMTQICKALLSNFLPPGATSNNGQRPSLWFGIHLQHFSVLIWKFSQLVLCVGLHFLFQYCNLIYRQ